MAIIVCTECQGKVSDQAEKCPHCGNPNFIPENNNFFSESLLRSQVNPGMPKPKQSASYYSLFNVKNAFSAIGYLILSAIGFLIFIFYLLFTLAKFVFNIIFEFLRIVFIVVYPNMNCPYCRQTISREASRCPFCTTDL